MNNFFNKNSNTIVLIFNIFLVLLGFVFEGVALYFYLENRYTLSIIFALIIWIPVLSLLGYTVYKYQKYQKIIYYALNSIKSQIDKFGFRDHAFNR